LVDKFGVVTFRDTCDALIELSARVTEERIRQIPEGIYEHMDFAEVEGVDGGLFPIHCGLTVKDGRLIFDFTRECQPQLPKFVNSTKLVVTGMVCSFLMPMLCNDVPWNEGCTYPIEIVTTPGSILDAQPPAPCSCPHVSFRAADAALGALNKALIHSPLKDRMFACWTSSPPVSMGMAPDPAGRYSIPVPFLEGMSGGGGAFSMKDGLDVGASISIMEYSMGDVETQENAYPILYLTRRFLRDSGGPGRYRGGVGSLVAIVPYKASGLKIFLVEDRRLIPSHGCVGGYPGASNCWWLGREMEKSKAISEGMGDSEEVLSQLEIVPPIATVDLGPEDIFAITSSGGGGFGDPLNRDSEKVARDVRWGFVSRQKAETIYGIVFEPGTLEVDEEQTRELKQKIRVGRTSNGNKVRSTGIRQESEYVILKAEGERIKNFCSRCGRTLSSHGVQWKDEVINKELRLDKIGMRIPGDDRIVLRQYICPDCGLLLECEVTLGRLEPFNDFGPIK